MLGTIADEFGGEIPVGPFALIGGVLGSVLTGGVLSLGSLVGFVTVLGIAARNGIMLVSHYRHLESEEGEPFGLGLVIRGSEERLAPILMTALATGLALVPLAVAGNKPGHEIEHPMAAAMNKIGYDAAAVGNHEFNYGIPYLRTFQKQLDFPLLAANAITGAAADRATSAAITGVSTAQGECSAPNNAVIPRNTIAAISARSVVPKRSVSAVRTSASSAISR